MWAASRVRQGAVNPRVVLAPPMIAAESGGYRPGTIHL